MMSQADPFLCPLRSHSNPPQFPYVLHDKSHHAFLLTLLGPFIHLGWSPPEPGFGRTGGGFGRVNRKLRGWKLWKEEERRGSLAHLGKVFNRGIKRIRRCLPFYTKLEILLLAQLGCNGRRRLGAGNIISCLCFLVTVRLF